MNQIQKNLWTSIGLCLVMLGGCAPKADIAVPPQSSAASSASEQQKGEIPDFTIDPETFALTMKLNGAAFPASLPGTKRKVEGLEKTPIRTSWSYPEEQIAVSVESMDEYLRVSISALAENDQDFVWPLVAGDEYFLPLGEGKRVPKDSSVWLDYLAGEKMHALEQLSMPFWATGYGENAVLFIMENPYRSSLDFADGKTLQFSLSHAYPELDPAREQSFRVYLTANDPVRIAKIYRDYKAEQGDFVTLKQKSEKSPDIEKLYGAPFIYLFDERVLVPEDVNWLAFRTALIDGKLNALKEVLRETETGREAVQALEQAAGQDYFDAYQKNVLIRAISEVLLRSDFYSSERFPLKNAEMDQLLNKGVEALTGVEQVLLNKHALAQNLPGVFLPVSQWAQDATVGIVEKLENAGIDRAWIGLNDWQQAYAKPELVQAAVDAGFLIGPYDSYHSIHEPGKEEWNTAAFEDETLYETASVMNQKGEILTGFNNVGRQLNPTLALPSVKKRMETILKTGLPFNSWFIDCDAAGEVFDDYSPEHRSTQQEDVKSRLERMEYIRDQGGLVIGSEGGNDYAASTIAFAHGIDLPTFSWMDTDMKTNKDSEYYIGNWFSITGGVPEHFAKVVPLKEKFYDLFLNPKYQIPLYKLVYNDSVITSYHWDWSTFKIQDRVEERMLREILFNVPPLFHLDETEWASQHGAITDHVKVWSAFSSKATALEMTGFSVLTEDCMVQQTEYGEGLSVVANFGKSPYSHEGQEISPLSLLIYSDGKAVAYTPHG